MGREAYNRNETPKRKHQWLASLVLWFPDCGIAIEGKSHRQVIRVRNDDFS
jgi:hypothetical protein